MLFECKLWHLSSVLALPTRSQAGPPRTGDQRNQGYNPLAKGIPMTIRISIILFFAAFISTTMAAQSEPVLVSANIPKHPPLACQARIGGVVKLTFHPGGERS